MKKWAILKRCCQRTCSLQSCNQKSVKNLRSGKQLAGVRGEVSHALFRKLKNCHDSAKASALILKKSALFMRIYELSYHLSSSYLSWGKNTEIFSCGTLLFFVIHKTFIEGPLTQNYLAVPKNFWL